jgi:hypothetical protein
LLTLNTAMSLTGAPAVLVRYFSCTILRRTKWGTPLASRSLDPANTVYSSWGCLCETTVIAVACTSRRAVSAPAWYLAIQKPD